MSATNLRYKITYPSGRIETRVFNSSKKAEEMNKKLRVLYGSDYKMERDDVRKA